jgi:methyl-accepting chemotaxis protein
MFHSRKRQDAKMNTFDNTNGGVMTVVKKLYAMIAIAILGMVLLAGVGTYQIERVNTAASYSTVNTVPSLVELDRISSAIYSIRIAALKYLSDNDQSVRQDAEKDIAAAQAQLSKSLDRYEKEDITDATDGELFKEIRKRVEAYRAGLAEDIKQGQTDPTGARKALLANQAIIDGLMAAIDEDKKYNQKLGTDAAQSAVGTKNQATLIAVGISLLMSLIIGLIGVLLASKIGKSLKSAVKSAESVASGDLTVLVNTTATDEIGQLQQALGRMIASLSNVVSEVRTGIHTITVASGEIAAGNMDLSSRTEQQAGSLEETASAMEELTSTVKQNADNARQANQMASSASQVASEGGHVVGQVVATMKEINDASRKIVDIISVIDGIAFQTNILALNAAVEAARAGEQGRGFAVVASEVRTLAQRSAAAAKEIKELIDNSVQKVEDGGKLVAQAGSTMEQVVSSVKHVTDVVSEISSASSEQSDGIDQVNQAITLMDEATQQNAALVEESSAAAQSLRDQAERLAQAVDFFKLNAAHQSLRNQSGESSRPRNTPVAPVKVPGPSGQSSPKGLATQVLPGKSKTEQSAPAIEHVLKSPGAPKEKSTDWEEF